MFSHFAPALLLAQYALAAPVTNAAAATVGKIRGVQSPIYHLYLQANPKNGSHTVSIDAASKLTMGRSFHACDGTRSECGRLHNRRHYTEQENRSISQYPDHEYKLQAARVGDIG